MSDRDVPETPGGTLPALLDSDGPTVPAPTEAGPAPAALELEPGVRLGRYRILGRLGAGAMGIVFEARDIELDRTVALKVVRPSGGDATAAQARLRREAQAMARLSHPNVAAVYDIGTIGEQLFIAMELVRGGTLRDLVGRRRPWRDELRTLIEAGRGLVAAHDAGVIHRDFKPDNVLVRADGTVRVADFGLAREPARDTDLAGAPASTQTAGMAGTPAYMAPESFDGAAGPATDQFAFAVTAFEVLEGHRPFERGATVDAQLAALRSGRRKPWRRRELPARVRAALDRALALDPSARWPSMSALCDALAPRRPRRLAWTLALFLAAAAAVGTAIAFRGSDPPTPPPTFNEAARQQLTFSGDASLSRLSPDGRWLAYAVGHRSHSVAIQDLKTGRSRVIYHDDQIGGIQWSHDGAWLLLLTTTAGNIVIDRDGTTRARPPRGLAAWSPDGARIVTTPPPAGEGLTFHDLATRKREHVKLALDATWVRGIDWSHLDRLAVLTKGRSDFKLWTVRPDGTELRRAATDAASSQVSLVGWSADGRAILYKRVRDQVVELVRLEIEPRSGTSGRASILLTTLPSDRDFSIAADGRSLVYVREEGSTNLARWSAGGTPRALTADTRNKHALALSHDRRRIAYAAGAGERTRIFIGPSDGTGATPIPNVEAAILDLDWSPAGTHIAYSVLRDGTPQLWTVDVATGETRRLAHSPMADHGDVAWASPGELLFSALGNAGYRALELETGRERELVPRGLKGWIFSAEPSPDGRQIAVYVNGPNTHGVWSISLDDGGARRLYLERLTPIGWSEDGAWVYVQDSERRLTYAISASGSGEIRSLFALPRPTLGKIRILLGEDEALALEEKAQADVWRISLDGPLPSSAFAPVEPLPEPHAQPSLVNPEMSLGAIGSPPPGWSPGPHDGTSVTTDRCLGASAPCASVSHGGWLEQRLVANPYRGKRIRLRVRTRVTGQSSLELRLQAPTRMAHLDTITATDTAGWHTLEIIADVRPDAQHLIIGLHAAGTSSALYDDVSLEVVER